MLQTIKKYIIVLAILTIGFTIYAIFSTVPSHQLAVVVNWTDIIFTGDNFIKDMLFTLKNL